MAALTEDARAAVSTFLAAPEELTTAEIVVLRSLDAELGDRAATRRGEAVTRAAAIRHAQAMGAPLPVTTTDGVNDLAETVLDLLAVQLATRQAAWEHRHRELEDRLVLLEASAAAVRS